MLDTAVTGSGTLARSIAERYGPMAFGLVVLLAIWAAIVTPAMREHREMLKDVSAIVHDARRAAEMLVSEAERQRVDARSDRR